MFLVTNENMGLCLSIQGLIQKKVWDKFVDTTQHIKENLIKKLFGQNFRTKHPVVFFFLGARLEL